MLGQAEGLGYCGPVAMETRPPYPAGLDTSSSIVSSTIGAF